MSESKDRDDEGSDSESDSGRETDTRNGSEHDSRKMQPKLAWVEKYRPKKWDQIIGNKQTISTIRKLVEGGGDNNVLAIPHMLFNGPPGTGKTTTISVAMKEMYGAAAEHMVLELNASNDRGIDVVRQKIIGFVGTSNYLYKACGIKAPQHSYKLVILDEVDWMTNDAQATLRRLMEETSDNARFCLICNYQNKIDPAIQSRCVPFRFQPLDPKNAVAKLREIADAESVKIDSSALATLSELSNGDMRKCINILQLMSLSHCKITDTDVYRHFGIMDRHQIEKLLEMINLKDGGQTKAYRHLCELVSVNGMDLKNVMTGMYRYMRNVKMKNRHRCKLLIDLAHLEICLGSTECEKIHIGALLGVLADWQKAQHSGKSSSSKKK